MNTSSDRQRDWICGNENRFFQELTELDQVYRNSPVGLVVVDRDMRFVRVNEHMAEINGKSVDEHIGLALDEVLPDLAEHLRKTYRQVLDTGEPVLDLEVSGFTPRAPGVLRHWLASYFPLRSEAGEIVGVLGAVTEITERKRMEEALLLTQFAVDRASDAVFWIEENAGFSYVNDAACKSLGYSREELLHLGVGDIDPIFPMDRWQEIWDDNREQGSRAFETLHRTKQGEVFPVEIRANFIEYGGKSLNCAFARNIAERKRSEEALKAGERLLRHYVEHTPAAVAMFDRDMRYLLYSKRWMTDYKLGDRDITGLSHYDVFPNIPEHWKEIHSKALAGAVERCEEDPFQREDGTIDWLRWEVSPWTDADGHIGGIVMFTEVITQRKRAENALRESDDALCKANRTLAALSRVNEILVRATEESNLLKDVCEAIVEVGGYRMAWVGFAVDDDEKTVRPAAHAGYENGYLECVKMSWGDNESGRGPVGNAIRTGALSIVDDVNAGPSYRPWREEAIKRGYGCSVSLPLAANGDILGAINLYRTLPGCLDAAEESLLIQLASDLSYGIASLRTKAERKAADAERRSLERRLEEHKRKFYRETIMSVTDGKLEVCEAVDVKPYVSKASMKLEVRQASDLGRVRKKVEEFLAGDDLGGEALASFIIGVGEATTNALKHGNRGAVHIGKTNEEAWVAVVDKGPGIDSLILPRAVLRRGFSTKPSLGLGYSIILDVADRILLKTGDHGTIVVLIKSLRKKDALSLEGIFDTWESIPDLVS